MERATQSNGIQRNAKYIAFWWARWCKKHGQVMDPAHRRQLESDLAGLLQEYQEQWGVDVVRLGLTADGLSIHIAEWEQ